MEKFNLEYYQKSADYILKHITERPKIAIILGSALGGVAERVENKITISYKDIPNMLRSTAPAHKGEYVFGNIGQQSVMIASGRFHHYEGYSYEQLAGPIRIMKLLGVKALIVTNAAGAVNLDYSVGDIMLIEDHIKLNGYSPMRGPNIDEFGPRFFDCTYIYKPQLLDLARSRAKALNLEDILQQGVYYFCPGPNFETPAEIRAIRILGGDAVGMSTVTETLTAAHCGIDVLGLSMITNMAAGVTADLQSGQDVIDTGKKTAGIVADFICDIVEHLEK
ncbi:MAG: purine-nucleoside phosphorylase [Clostridiaceae bacterium]|nr:purine-nucleoside phosphorylase [Clostridiaceae bacterium]